MPRRLLQRVALFTRRRYRWVFVASAVLVAIAAALTTRLEFDTDFLNLLPQKAAEVQTFRRNLEEFGSVEVLLVAIRVPEGAIVDPFENLADRLGERMSALPEFERVEYQLGELDELLETFMPQALLFLDEEERAAVVDKVSEESLAVRARELRRLLATPQALTLKRLVTLDPLGLSEIFLERLNTARGGLSLDWSSGYLLSTDHRMLLLLGKPIKPPQDVQFNRRLVEVMEEEIDGLRPEWPELAQGTDLGFPEVALGGRYVIALGDEALIRRDAISNFLTSLFGVLLLFLFAFRRFGVLLYAFVPLFCGLVLTFGFSSLSFGVLNSATSGVAALLIGLGIDFVIVSYGRFVEERHKGKSFEDALALMNGSSGRAVLVGAVTSAATFYAFAVTEFKGLSQMGVLTGTGILFCMVAVLYLLPSLLAWSHDRHERRRTYQRLFLHDLGSTALIRASLARPGLVLGIGLLVTVFAGASALQLRFEDSVKSMRPAGNPGTEVWEEVALRFGSGFEQMSFIASGSSLDEAFERAAEASAEAAELVRAGWLDGYDGIQTVIPPKSQQEAALAWLERERRGSLDMERIRERFELSMTAAGLRVAPFERGFDLFAAAVARAEPIGIVDFRQSAQADRLLERYLVRSGDVYRSAVYLYPPPKVWAREAPPAVHAAAERLGPEVELTGANVLNAFLRKRVLRDAVVAAVLGFVLVGVLLWLDFRNLRDTLMSLAPLCVGIAWMLGAMAALGLAMNFMNIFVTTMIIGIGVDYGVHMLHRYRELAGSSEGDYAAGLSETGKAIVLAALSTIVGLGSLSLSHYPGLQSMGKVAILGAVSTALVAITVLPAYMARRIERHQTERSD